jgi:hypothetical protein
LPGDFCGKLLIDMGLGVISFGAINLSFKWAGTIDQAALQWCAIDELSVATPLKWRDKRMVGILIDAVEARADAKSRARPVHEYVTVPL